MLGFGWDRNVFSEQFLRIYRITTIYQKVVFALSNLIPTLLKLSITIRPNYVSAHQPPNKIRFAQLINLESKFSYFTIKSKSKANSSYFWRVEMEDGTCFLSTQKKNCKTRTRWFYFYLNSLIMADGFLFLVRSRRLLLLIRQLPLYSLALII